MPRKPMTEPDLPERDAAPDEIVALPPSTSSGVPLRKSFIPELYRFLRTVPADAPYDQLGAMAQSAGWIWRMVERDCYASSENHYAVRFDVLIGKATNDLELEYFDTLTMSVPVEAPSPSLIARLNAQVALTYMVFNRLPPPVQQAQVALAPEPQQAQATPAPEPQQAQVSEPEEVEWQKPGRAPVVANDLPLAVIRRRTPDGIPIMGDPYEMNGTPDEIVAAILDTFASGAEEANDKTILNTLWSKNDSAVEFVKDFGSASDKAALRNIFKVRAEQIG